MKNLKRKALLISLVFIIAGNIAYANSIADTIWQAGVTKADITPEGPISLAGYGSRSHPSDGVLHKIWAKCLAMQDAEGKRAVLITTDLLGMPKGLSDKIRDELYKKFKLSKAQILINSSHTHSAPILQDALFDIYELNKEELAKVKAYSEKLVQTLVHLVGEAFQKMQPAKIFSNNGVVRFQVNRRNNNEGNLIFQEDLKGPNDYAVPVIKVEDGSGKLLGIAFGYACHATSLGIYQVSGDYPGFAQIELEKMYPGSVAMFFQGAGADQNPLPRKTIALSEQYGKELAIAVSCVLKEPMKVLYPRLQFAYNEVALPFDTVANEKELQHLISDANTSAYQKRWAKRMIEAKKKNIPQAESYPYPLQVWQIGEQKVFGLGGELVIRYSIELKKKYGQDIFVLGYSNDVMSYIPSEVILKEGGYEGALAHFVYGLPAKWAPGIQEKILNALNNLIDHLK